MRKTKVRIVGDPEFAGKVAQVIKDHFVLEVFTKYNTAVGRDYSHSNSPGCTVYIGIKEAKA